MIQDDYVTFSQAKQLREIGFPKDGTVDMYDAYGADTNYFSSWKQGEYAKPTLCLAAKWLRENKNIFINITYTDNKYTVWLKEVKDSSKYLSDNLGFYDKLEKALSVALDKAIEILNKQ